MIPTGPQRTSAPTCAGLFSAAARPAAFCELVGAVLAYITTGSKPGLRADLPPADLLAACDARFAANAHS